jgi:hypothetical protein
MNAQPAAAGEARQKKKNLPRSIATGGKRRWNQAAKASILPFAGKARAYCVLAAS